jgi:hypothetical protein
MLADWAQDAFRMLSDFVKQWHMLDLPTGDVGLVGLSGHSTPQPAASKPTRGFC